MNQRSSSKQRRPKTTRKKSVARKPLRRWLRTWKRARFKQRLAMILVPLVAVICVTALVVGLTTFVRWRREVDAATAAQNATAQRYGFNPGNIISDGQFFNEHAMSQAEVQAFLDQQGGALASMRFDTASHPADELCEAYEGATDESAAAVIDKSARACGISQKVLLTMLQKEQHLVTATAPTDFQIRAAMGLSCPDDANCDPAYAGFFNQVYGAARRYRYYLNHPDDYAYHADGSTTCSTAPSRPAAAARSTSRTTRPHCSTSTRPISRIRPRWRPEPARATRVPPTATATSR